MDNRRKHNLTFHIFYYEVPSLYCQLSGSKHSLHMILVLRRKNEYLYFLQMRQLSPMGINVVIVSLLIMARLYSNNTWKFKVMLNNVKKGDAFKLLLPHGRRKNYNQYLLNNKPQQLKYLLYCTLLSYKLSNVITLCYRKNIYCNWSMYWFQKYTNTTISSLH